MCSYVDVGLLNKNLAILTLWNNYSYKIRDETSIFENHMDMLMLFASQHYGFVEVISEFS